MNVESLLPILAFGTLLGVLVFAAFNAARTRHRLHDPSDPGSSLARRTPDPNFLPDPRVTRKDLYPDADTPVKQAPIVALGPASPARHPNRQHGFDDRRAESA